MATPTSNVRRIEAVTGFGPVDLVWERERELDAAAGALGVPRSDLLEAIS